MEITLLDNKKTIANLVEVDIHDSILGFIENELSKKEYNFVITADDIPKVKKIMADLNKSKDFIDTFRKDKVIIESVAIDLFKSNVKEYLALIDTKREEIKKNVEVFERETKDKILKELSLYSEEFIKSQNIREMFKDIDIIDLMILGSVTSKGALTKKAKEVIESRVMVCKSKQDKYDMRLLGLENESRKAGLESILTITHVQGIIMLDDSEYERGLENLIIDEINRQHTIKTNLQAEATETANREAQQKVINEQNRIKVFLVVNCDSFDLATTDSKIVEFTNMDYSSYGDYADFARSFVGEQISKLNFHRNDLLKKANDLLAEMESKQKPNIEIVEETIPFTQNEKQDQVKEVAANVEVGKKVVFIDVHLQFKVKDTIPNEKIIAKVNEKLKGSFVDKNIAAQISHLLAGNIDERIISEIHTLLSRGAFGESLLSVEVV